MLKFSRERNTQPYPDSTAGYKIDLEEGDTPIRTVQEFIDTVLSQYPDEWGDIAIQKPTERWSSPFDFVDVECSYFHGTLTKTLPPEYLNKEIVLVSAAGGYTNVDYLIKTY